MNYRDATMLQFLAYFRDEPFEAASRTDTLQIIHETTSSETKYPLSVKEWDYYQAFAKQRGWLQRGVPDGFPGGGDLAPEGWEQSYFITLSGLEYLRLRSDQALVAEAQRKQISLIERQNAILFGTLMVAIVALLISIIAVAWDMNGTRSHASDNSQSSDAN